jgi:translocation and assembly module TamB
MLLRVLLRRAVKAWAFDLYQGLKLKVTLKRSIVIAFAAVVLLGLAALTAAGLYLNSNAFRHRISAYANEHIRGTLVFSDHRFAPLGGRLRLDNIELRDFEGTLLLAAERASAELSYTALLGRIVRLDHVRLERAYLNVDFDSQDRLRLPQVAEGTAESAPPTETRDEWQVVIAELSVRESTIDYRRPVKGWSARGEGLDLQGRLDLRRTAGQVRVTMTRLDWQGPDRAGTIAKPQIDAAYHPRNEAPLRLTVTTSDGRLDFSGEVQPDDAAPRIQGALDFDLALPAVQKWLPHSVALTGRVQGRLSVRGALFDPDADLSFTIRQATAYGIAVERLEGRAGLHQRHITIERLHSLAPWGETELSGHIDLRPLFKTDLRTFEDGAPNYQFSVDAQKVQPGLIPAIEWPWEGTYNLNIEAEGRGVDTAKRQGRAQLTLATRNARAVQGGEPLDGALSARLSWQGAIIKVEQSRLEIGPNAGSVHGRIDLGERQLDTRAELVLDNLAELGPLLGTELPQGRATLQLSAAGDLHQPTLEAEVKGHDLQYADWHASTLETDLRLTPDGVLMIGRLHIRNQESEVTGSGTIGLLEADGALRDQPPLAATLDLRNVPLTDLGLPPVVAGALSGTLEIGNTLYDPSGRLHLMQSPLRWQAFDFNVQGTAQWQSGRLMVSDLDLKREQSQVRLNGSIAWRDGSGGWTADPLIDIRLTSERLRLEDLPGGYTGTLSAQAEVHGHPTDLQGPFSITGGPLNLGFQELSAVSATGRLAGDRVEVTQVKATIVAGQSLQGDGWYSWDQHFELALESDGIDLRYIAALKAAGPLQGRLTLRATGAGTLQAPRIEADAAILDPRFDEQRFDDFQINARLAGRQVDLSADLNFRLTAQADLAGGDFRIEADFARTDMTPYLGLAAGQAWSGRLSGKLAVSGNRQDPLALDGRLDLSEVRIDYQNTSVLMAESVHMGMHNGVLDVPGVRMQVMQSGYLELFASGDWQGDIQARVAGRVPLAALTPFNETLGEAEGQVRIQGEAQGPLDALEWQADLIFEQVAFAIPEMLQTVSELNGRVRLGVRELLVENLSGRIDTGRFSLDGRVGLKAWQPVDGRLRLHAQALPLYWPDTADFLVSGDLELTGDARQALLSGELELLEGIYYRNFRLNLLSAITQTRRVEGPAVPTVRPEWMRRIAVEVDLTHRHPFLVDNNIANLTIAPDFKIGGTLAAPLISGRAEVVEGEIIYRRKSFDVTRGVVDFINPYRNDPSMDIAAQTTIGQYHITLAVSGTAEQLVFNMNSDPPLSDNDILSLVLIGRTSGETTPGAGGGPSTSQMLTSLIATAWGEDIRQRTGVDILEVETGAQAGEPQSPQDRIQVTLGKRLSRRLTVKYEVETSAGERVQRAVSEYRFMENVLAKGFQDNLGRYGGEVLFRLEFR